MKLNSNQNGGTKETSWGSFRKHDEMIFFFKDHMYITTKGSTY